MTVADDQPPARLVDLVLECLDVGGDLGLQRRRQHLPGTVADDCGRGDATILAAFGERYL